MSRHTRRTGVRRKKSNADKDAERWGWTVRAYKVEYRPIWTHDGRYGEMIQTEIFLTENLVTRHEAEAIASKFHDYNIKDVHALAMTRRSWEQVKQKQFESALVKAGDILK